jgi:hypothetical protein
VLISKQSLCKLKIIRIFPWKLLFNVSIIFRVSFNFKLLCNYVFRVIHWWLVSVWLMAKIVWRRSKYFPWIRPGSGKSGCLGKIAIGLASWILEILSWNFQGLCMVPCMVDLGGQEVHRPIFIQVRSRGTFYVQHGMDVSLQVSIFEILSRNFGCGYFLLYLFCPANKILEFQGRNRRKRIICVFF